MNRIIYLLDIVKEVGHDPRNIWEEIERRGLQAEDVLVYRNRYSYYYLPDYGNIYSAMDDMEIPTDEELERWEKQNEEN